MQKNTIAIASIFKFPLPDTVFSKINLFGKAS
jgi:hypothetical protein